MPRRTYHAARLAALCLAGVVLARGAAADMFRYTDRSGRAHVISTGQPRTTQGSPAPANAPAPAPDAAPAPPAPPASSPYYELAREAAEANALPVELVLAVAEVESGFDPRAVSPKGALGLMQLMPATASLLGVTEPFDPKQNVGGGARLLRTLLDDFGGQIVLALAAYNAGAAVVKRYGVIPPIAETQEYVVSVLKAYQRRLGARRGEGGAFAAPPLVFERTLASAPAGPPPSPRRAASRTAAHPGRRPATTRRHRSNDVKGARAPRRPTKTPPRSAPI